MKHTFIVPDMTCGHCVKMITQAVQAADADAQVHADTQTHQVTVETTQLDEAAVLLLLQEAGYTPKNVA